MRIRGLDLTTLAAALLLAGTGLRGQDPGLLLRRQPRRQPRRLQPAVLHHRHHARCLVGADVQQAGRVRPRNHERGCRLGRELDRGSRRPELHLQAAPRRQVPRQFEVHADARLQCRRRAVLVQPHGRPGAPVPQDVAGPDLRLLRRYGHEEHRRPAREGRSDDGALRAEETRGAFHGQPGDRLRLGPECRIRRQDEGRRHARGDRPRTDRHRPVPVCQLPEGCGDSLQGLRRPLVRPAEDRQRAASRRGAAPPRMACASARPSASGFSHNTCLPARAAFTAQAACRLFGSGR